MALRTAHARADAVSDCRTCGDLLGRGYPGCDGCLDRVEELLLADWRPLLEAEEITAGSVAERRFAESVVSEKPDKRRWTCVDQALSLLPCPDCRGALGSGDQDCPRCAAADAHRWRWSTPDDREAALRSATLALRAPQRVRPAMVTTWRLCLPFVLAGQALKSYQRRKVCVAVLAGREAELAAARTFGDLLAVTEPPWRGVSATSQGRVSLPVR